MIAAGTRIAMWSGPRNLSTALMRSFGSRGDCAVSDEPFYAAYLSLSGAMHPMRDDILRHQENDWEAVARQLAGPPPGGRAIWYQKHMTHHMLPAIDRGWMRACRHAFLIRHPARVLASYAAKREQATFADIGFREQAELFHVAADLAGETPVVIDADTLLARPGEMLERLCAALAIPFTAAMLTWEPGGRDSDGVWASHWYDAVARSTRFGQPKPLPRLEDAALRRAEAEALPIYLELARFGLS